MKKIILAVATIVALTTGNTFAQRYNRPNPKVIDARADHAYEEFKINKLDDIVKLSRKQENKIKKIENKYDRLAGKNQRFYSYQNMRKLEQEKQKEILSVLTPVQRQRWFAYQQRFDNHYNRRG